MCKSCEPVKRRSLTAQFFSCFENVAFKLLCTTLGKHCKRSLGMQRPVMNNSLSKERCATFKGRKAVMGCGYACTHTM